MTTDKDGDFGAGKAPVRRKTKATGGEGTVSADDVGRPGVFQSGRALVVISITTAARATRTLTSRLADKATLVHCTYANMQNILVVFILLMSSFYLLSASVHLLLILTQCASRDCFAILMMVCSDVLF